MKIIESKIKDADEAIDSVGLINESVLTNHPQEEIKSHRNASDIYQNNKKSVIVMGNERFKINVMFTGI